MTSTKFDRECPKVGVVIPARNEEKYLPKTLLALRKQTLKPFMIVVIDDGSHDNTPLIAERYGAYVVRLRDRGFRSLGLPLVAEVINIGFDVLKKENVDFVLKLDADHILSHRYIEILVKAMIKDNTLVVTSGIILGERFSIDSPRGSGRIINAEWFKRIGFRYPVWWGYETWLLFKALMDGYKVMVIPQAISWVQRRTAWSPLEMYEWGRGMNALGYHPLYIIARSLMAAFKHGPKHFAYMMLGGILERTKKYPNINAFVKVYTLKHLISKVLRPYTI